MLTDQQIEMKGEVLNEKTRKTPMTMKKQKFQIEKTRIE